MLVYCNAYSVYLYGNGERTRAEARAEAEGMEHARCSMERSMEAERCKHAKTLFITGGSGLGGYSTDYNMRKRLPSAVRRTHAKLKVLLETVLSIITLYRYIHVK